MKCWANDTRQIVRRLALAALVVGLGLAGCGKQAADNKAADKPAATAANAGGSTENGNPTAAAANQGAAVQRDRLYQSFADATRNADDPPPQAEKPPDQTMTGKATFKLLKEVQQLWDTIRFTDASGKPVPCSATLETDFGVIEITLLPAVAPNHVRNFIALAKAGYYDQLLFDRIRHEESNNNNDPSPLKLNAVEGGCPVGKGDDFSGSIGYWLKPEFDDKLKHVEGTVGACHGMEADSAACRFYITLNEDPVLDGSYTIFGKVTRGLDVVRRIAQQPVIVDDDGRDGCRRPMKPIVIKKVTIHMGTRAGAES